MDLEHERNINNITSEDVYTSPMKKKEAKTINDSVYHVLDEHADKIIDSIKQVDASKKPILTLTLSTEFVTYQLES